jgi:MATE family multidrug resistance protein
VSSPLRHIVRLAIPLAAGQLGFTVMGLVDTAFMGRTGAAPLAAVSLGGAIFFAVAVLCMGVVSGMEPLVSQAVGGEQPGRARVVMRQGVVLSLLVTVPGLLLLAIAYGLLPYVGIDEEIWTRTRGYLLGRAPGLPGWLLYMALRGYLGGHNVTRPTVIAVISANLVNVPADWLLIFGDDGLVRLGLSPVGLPALEATGAGLATSLCLWVQVAVLAPATAVLGERAPDPRPATARWLDALAPAGLLRIARVGLPIGLQFSLEVSFFSSVAFLMGRLGAVQLASHQVAITLASAPFQICLGIGSATAVVVGQRIGAGDKRGTLHAGLGGLGLGVALMCFTGTFFLLMPEVFVRMFTDDAAVIAASAPLVRIAGFFALSDGAQAVISGALRGAGDTTWPFFIHLVAHWCVGMPTALYLAFRTGLGAQGLWWGLTTGLTFAATLLVIRFVRRARRGYIALETEAL